MLKFFLPFPFLPHLFDSWHVYTHPLSGIIMIIYHVICTPCRYCECFAAGVYCIEPCACQDCFNKPIHEDTVLATRKQIESRNPLAFAPKVIRSSEPAPEIGVSSNLILPFS
jgi:hypothetical protein